MVRCRTSVKLRNEDEKWKLGVIIRRVIKTKDWTCRASIPVPPVVSCPAWNPMRNGHSTNLATSPPHPPTPSLNHLHLLHTSRPCLKPHSTHNHAHHPQRMSCLSLLHFMPILQPMFRPAMTLRTYLMTGSHSQLWN